jgi:hypothetical protein
LREYQPMQAAAGFSIGDLKAKLEESIKAAR